MCIHIIDTSTYLDVYMTVFKMCVYISGLTIVCIYILPMYKYIQAETHTHTHTHTHERTHTHRHRHARANTQALVAKHARVFSITFLTSIFAHKHTHSR
jgi:hypothetical protein